MKIAIYKRDTKSVRTKKNCLPAKKRNRQKIRFSIFSFELRRRKFTWNSHQTISCSEAFRLCGDQLFSYTRALPFFFYYYLIFWKLHHFSTPKWEFRCNCKENEHICNICRFVKFLSDFNNNHQLLSVLHSERCAPLLFSRCAKGITLCCCYNSFFEPPSKPSLSHRKWYFSRWIITPARKKKRWQQYKGRQSLHTTLLLEQCSRVHCIDMKLQKWKSTRLSPPKTQQRIPFTNFIFGCLDVQPLFVICVRLARVSNFQHTELLSNE